MDIQYGQLQLQDGIDLAEFMVDATIRYLRFANREQDCGGPIDILVMTKDQAYWHQHKHLSAWENISTRERFDTMQKNPERARLLMKDCKSL